MTTRIEVRISGLGGQGVVLAGEVLGRAAVFDGKFAVQTQSYGAEARGSAARSDIIISDESIGFPKIGECDVLVAMSQGAFDKHLETLREDGILLIDSTNVKNTSKAPVKVHQIPASQIAENEWQSRIYANVIILGALTKILGIVRASAVEKAITASVSDETKQRNLSAFRRGLKLVR